MKWDNPVVVDDPPADWHRLRTQAAHEGCVMRRFHLVRDEDPTGISGTGIVAEGVEFSDGVVVVRWLRRRDGPSPTTVVHDTIMNVESLHGHNGSSHIEFLDRVG